MPLDPKVRELLDLRADTDPIGTAPIEEMRAAAPAQMAELFRMGMVVTPVAAVEDRFIPGPVADLPVRVLTPGGRGPFPVVVFSTAAGGCSATWTRTTRCAGYAGCLLALVTHQHRQKILAFTA